MDNVFRLQYSSSHFSSIVQFLVMLSWWLFARDFAVRYIPSLILALAFMGASLIGLLFNLSSVADFFAQCAFLFLSLGIFQMVFQKS